MKILYVGWCKKNNHDKVWCAIRISDNSKYAIFWGRRGNKLQSKIVDSTEQLISNVFNLKLKNGYNRIDLKNLDTIYPDFKKDLEKTAIWSILSYKGK